MLTVTKTDLRVVINGVNNRYTRPQFICRPISCRVLLINSLVLSPFEIVAHIRLHENNLIPI